MTRPDFNQRLSTAKAMRRAIDAAGVALWTWNVDNDAIEMDVQGYDLWNVTPGEDLTFELLSERIHPADRDRVRAAFAATRGIVGRYEIDFRTVIGRDVRWISARGQGDDEDIAERVMAGVFLDVTGRKQAEESSELLAGEMSHRVRNLLTVASGLAKITSRSSSSIEDMTTQLSKRLTALGRAHDLVRPLPGGQGRAALLGDLLTVLLAPYDDQGAFAERIRVAVPRLGVGENSAGALALVIHELATNALKHGALSSDTGTLDVSGNAEGDRIQIVWTEAGGPEVKPPGDRHGYGSKLVQSTIAGPLDGTISHDWNPSGLLVTFDLSVERLAD